MSSCKIFIILLLFLISFGAYCQTDSIAPIKIEEVVIHAVRLPEKVIDLPISITALSFKDNQEQLQQLSFNEYLQNVPGLFALNANNFAQDLRVSIRGFGARAAFGIRGVKIIVDGIPETTPDGQGQIDNLNLGIIDQIEVIRGPSSSLYGNASGGVINISTFKKIDKDYIQLGTTFGSYTMQKYQLQSGLKFKKTDLILLGTHTVSDGYRERSAFESSNFNASVIHHFNEKSILNLNLNYANSPKAEDAGGLKLEDVAKDREQARDRNVLYNTGETINQFRFAMAYEYHVNRNQLFKTYGFYSNRNFYGKLPFKFGGIIDLKRDYFGFGSSYQINKVLKNGTNKIQVGYELALQKDHRNRFKNEEGIQGDLVFNQLEKFNNVAVYLIDHLHIGKWNFNGGLRYDWNELKADDKFLSNGDNSGRINLNSFNPSIGLSYSIKTHQSIYANFSTSFETPSLSELSANPTGNEGLNDNLEAQQSRNYELGWKGYYNNNLNMEIAIFHIDTDNEIVPYELEAFPDRKFFRNAGSSKRDGVEIQFNYRFLPQWRLAGSYTYSDFKFDTFIVKNKDFSKNQLPGIPKNMASLELNYHTKQGLNFQLNGRYNGTLYANNSNKTQVAAYTVLNTNIAYKFQIKKMVITPFFGVNNLLNTSYYDNIRINAFGGRYYEPAPEIHFYGGLKVRIN